MTPSIRFAPRTLVVAILGAAILVAALVLNGDGRASADEAGDVEKAAYPRGPHDGRLLSDGPLQLEVTIYESGVEPHFRIYPYDAKRAPLAPDQVALRVELHRLGGRVDTIAFAPEAEYLKGTSIVEEPHSFDVLLFASYEGVERRWEYSQIEGKVELGADQLASAGISIDTVRSRALLTRIDLPGEILTDATRRAHITARVAGVVTAVFKQEGDRVAQGDVLATVESRELADAKSAYLLALRQIDFTRTTKEREYTLWQRKISAERDYLTAQQALDEAELRARLAAQTLVTLGVPAEALSRIPGEAAEEASRMQVRATRSGTVTERTATVGESVSADASLFEIADLSVVWVEAAVHAGDLAAVRQGQSATIRSTDLGEEVEGRIAFVGPLVGDASRTALARIVLPNRAGIWRPGLFVTVRVVKESSTVPMAVANEAIQTFRDWQVVFVKHGDWFEARPLTLGRSDGVWREVLSGLRPGDEYARANSFAVKAEIGKLGATHDH